MTTPSIPEWATEVTCALDEKLGLVYTEISADRTSGYAPVEGNTQPMGIWHGGATCVMAESLGSFAAWAHARERGMIAVGVEINATHHASASKGFVHGVATAIRLGESTASYHIELTDDGGRRIATARLTCFIRPAPKLDAPAG